MDSRNCRPPSGTRPEIRLPHVVAGILPRPRERPAPPGLLNADAAASMQDAVYIVLQVCSPYCCAVHDIFLLTAPKIFSKILRLPLLTKAKNMIIMHLISNDKPVRKKSSTAQGIPKRASGGESRSGAQRCEWPSEGRLEREIFPSRVRREPSRYPWGTHDGA